MSNQLLDLRQTAERFGWQVVSELVDDGISGAKGRGDRAAFDRLFHMIQRRECQVVMAWDVSRLGRSIQDLVGFMKEVQSAGIDLYIHQQAINTATASGRMVFGIFSALREYERELIRERINAGLRPVLKAKVGSSKRCVLRNSPSISPTFPGKADADPPNRQITEDRRRHRQQEFLNAA